MKKSIFLILLAAGLTLKGCASVSAPDDNVDMTDTGEAVQTAELTAVTAPVFDAEACYRPILDELYSLVSCAYDDDYYADLYANDDLLAGTVALMEGNGWGSSDVMLNYAGYTIRDMSGDGVPELLIGSVDHDGSGNGTAVYALYTAVNGQPQAVFDGSHRSMYYFLDDGVVFYQGSGGALYSIFALYDLTVDGGALVCQDYCFTHEKDGNFEDVHCWHNMVGKMDVAVSEELAMTLEEFWETEAEYGERIADLALIPFAEYDISDVGQ